MLSLEEFRRRRDLHAAQHYAESLRQWEAEYQAALEACPFAHHWKNRLYDWRRKLASAGRGLQKTRLEEAFEAEVEAVARVTYAASQLIRLKALLSKLLEKEDL